MMDSVSVPSNFIELAGRLVLATALGAAAGLNRELRQKPAGIRTHALVALGGALASIVGVTLTALAGGPESGAISRVAQGVLAGIGFIGGGVILRRETHQLIQGLTTAALLWVVAIVGVAAGLGLWRSAVTTVALAWIVLVGGHTLEERLHEKTDQR